MITYFTREDLKSFGDYLLSQKRKERTSELMQNEVHYADIENWIEEAPLEALAEKQIQSTDAE